jgi:tRNA threonylcarbamoyladenosine biosynthesis protein TsaE
VSKYEIELLDAASTYELGQKIAKSFKPGLLYLHGDLGAGKTTFCQGFIRALIDCRVLSPTYAYVTSYKPPVIHHFDLYRIDEPEKILELGLDMLLTDDKAIRLVEWPEHLGALKTKPSMDIYLEKFHDHRRAFIHDHLA